MLSTGLHPSYPQNMWTTWKGKFQNGFLSNGIVSEETNSRYSSLKLAQHIGSEVSGSP